MLINNLIRFSLTDVAKDLQKVDSSQDLSPNDVIGLGVDMSRGNTADNIEDNDSANEMIQISKEMDNTCKL